MIEKARGTYFPEKVNNQKYDEQETKGPQL